MTRATRMPAVAAMLCLATAGIWAKDLDIPDLSQNIALYVQLDLMSERGAFRTPVGIQDMQRYSVILDPEYRDLLFRDHRKNPWLAAVLNLTTGGLGSILMGDPLTGVLLQAGALVSYGLLALPLFGVSILPATTLYTVAGALGVSVSVVGVVVPFLFAGRWNGQLSRALSLPPP